MASVAHNPRSSRRAGVISMMLGAWAAFILFVGPLQVGCQKQAPVGASTHQVVTLGGKRFNLELALDAQSRFRGLSERTNIPADGGMLFVFPDQQVTVHSFVMRDCPEPIDIIYLDRSGRITAMHTMQPDPPRTEAEKVLSAPYPGAPQWAWTNEAYENRLTKYSSRYAAQFVIELRGGTLPTLGLKDGQRVDLPLEELRKRAR